MWIGGVLALLSGLSLADERIENSVGHRQICDGIYGPESHKGKLTPGVKVDFSSKHQTDGEVALAIYPFEEIEHLGFPSHTPNGVPFTKYICDQPAVYAGQCSADDLGKFIVNDNDDGAIYTDIIKISGSKSVDPISFDVKKTGYYCVAVHATPGHEDMKYDVTVKFQSSRGELPDSDQPLVLFHFIQCMVYIALMAVWTIRLIQHRQYMLKLQKYITAMGYIMVIEQGVLTAYYFVVNHNNKSAGARTMLAFVAIMGSARLAFTFFLLLIVGCGYSVVHPSLGKKMGQCRMAAGGLFIVGLVYFLLSYFESSEQSTSSVFNTVEAVFSVALIIMVTLNYFLTLHWMGNTVQYLTSRKQTGKVSMYRKLSGILVMSAILVMLEFVFQFVRIAFLDMKDFFCNMWKYDWLMSDGWPNMVYCLAFTLIMILWRPNSDNKRYAMSTQLAQNEEDAEEFEIGSLNGSDDEFEQNFESESFDVGAQRTRRTAEFDSQRDHGLSDFETQSTFESEQPGPANEHDRHIVEDEDPLVDAPSKKLN